MGQIDTSFQCADRPYGYYADQGNDCRVFHVCNPYLFDDGRVETHQYSFMCGEDRIFDQQKLTCVEAHSALSCQEASNFYFKNEDFGRPEEKF
ncbi:U-scoloptoxin(01)-Er1a-like [Oratosquilla oratoria]|uniref:U-scoloptoxin(01)-Er1a-like n=1 Tax=Oratosquilla oratoria TaxID=337810 RepID=UPI003F76C69B